MAEAKGLFINLTTAKENYASKAFRLGTRIAKEGKISIVHLNVDAVIYSSPKCGIFADPVTNQPLVSTIQNFMNAGGKILVGADCMKTTGILPEDIYEGMEVAGPENVLPPLMDTEMQVITY